MKLFESYSVNGKLRVVNRIVMPALVTRLATEDGHVTDEGNQ
jgi:2,4-dienoyl-CoA reductase-like NADH-dependent reductase (Old Yellow Enzyme family)